VILTVNPPETALLENTEALLTVKFVILDALYVLVLEQQLTVKLVPLDMTKQTELPVLKFAHPMNLESPQLVPLVLLDVNYAQVLLLLLICLMAHVSYVTMLLDGLT